MPVLSRLLVAGRRVSPQAPTTVRQQAKRTAQPGRSTRRTPRKSGLTNQEGGSPSHAAAPAPLPAPARPTQPSEPILLPKLRIRLADFPYLHCSIGQRLFTLETGCGHGYDPRRESQHFPRIFKDQPERTGRRRRRGALRSRRPSLRSNRFQGSRSLTRKDNSSRGPGQCLRARLLHSVRPPQGRRAPPSGSGILTRFPFAQRA